MFYLHGSAGGRWLMGMVSTAVLVELILLVPAAISASRTHAREAQTKQNLHEIQLGLERFSVDSPGNIYPAWISGGGPAGIPAPGSPEEAQLDPLILGGYIASYPRNPFCPLARRPGRVRRELESMQVQLNDELRPGRPAIDRPAMYRFGEDCSLMGNLLAASPVAVPGQFGVLSASPAAALPGGGITYPFWDTRALDRPQDWLQGQFIYRPWTAAECCRNPAAPLHEVDYEYSSYMLAGFGGSRTKGQDIVSREEREKLAMHEARANSLWIPAKKVINPCAGDDADYVPRYESSEYETPLDDGGRLIVNRQNGIPDGVIIVLSSGCD